MKEVLGKKNIFMLRVAKEEFFAFFAPKENLNIEKKNIWLISTTAHNNIGDLAITKAEVEFLKDYYKDYNLITINDREFYGVYKKIRKNIKNNDIIFIHGGGNMGNEYFVLEWQRWQIIRRIRNNKIIILPQTIFVSNNQNATINKNKYMKIAKEIYEQENVHIFVREKFSYDFIKSNFANSKVYLVPDIVLSLRHKVKNQRKNVVFCFRDDFEKIISNELVQNIKDLISSDYKIHKTSMIYSGNKDVLEFQNEIVLDKLDEFSKYKLCVTDRLHAMILCAIVGTPCIAFNNHSKKVEGVYKWIEELSYIRVVDGFEEFKIALDEIEWRDSKSFVYNVDFENLYKKIIDISLEN
ncbi:MAG: hypothetical protein GX282_07320 [Campylobacteraceae bacterium]|nr:hypothetical protein [Campylobacteraceae bacterium]